MTIIIMEVGFVRSKDGEQGALLAPDGGARISDDPAPPFVHGCC